MKKYVVMIIGAFVINLALPSCTSISNDEFTVETNSETIEQKTEDIALVDEPVKELLETDNNIIDFTFTQAINSTVPAFTFNILGEIFGEIRTNSRINTIQVNSIDGELIQEIRFSAYPPDSSENNQYGLEFDDYNGDGYLDMSIRRFPGELQHDRTHFYWLWNTEIQQFVYDWKLSEVVTEENLIDFSVTQSIHDEIAPFTFRLLGRWIEGWSSDIQAVTDKIDANIHVMQIIDNNGKVIQEFDRLDTKPTRYDSLFGLHFADYNFDGYLDIALFKFEGGTMRNEPHIYWLWDINSKQFVENERLSEISDSSSISINLETKQLEAYTRFSAGMGIIRHFDYIDNNYIFVYSNEWGYKLLADGEEDRYVRYEIIEKLIDGEIIVTENYYDD